MKFFRSRNEYIPEKEPSQEDYLEQIGVPTFHEWLHRIEDVRNSGTIDAITIKPGHTIVVTPQTANHIEEVLRRSFAWVDPSLVQGEYEGGDQSIVGDNQIVFNLGERSLESFRHQFPPSERPDQNN